MFSFGIGTSGGPQFYIWRDNDPYSRSDVYSNSVSYAKLSKLRPFAYYLTINLKGDDIYVTYSASENSAILRVTLVPDGRIELLLWQEINNDWLSLWQWPSTYCDFYAQCSPFSSCDPKGTLLDQIFTFVFMTETWLKMLKKSAKFTRKKTHPDYNCGSRSFYRASWCSMWLFHLETKLWKTREN
ncbi:hypothetical protein OIU78_026782 [Salix suchowensis]|nr:hypothetical protein OIU78_026782 [Salix suchowensis]